MCAQSFPGIILFLEEDPVVAGRAEQGRAAATVKALWLAHKISSYWQSLFILHICPTITRCRVGFFFFLSSFPKQALPYIQINTVHTWLLITTAKKKIILF